MLQKIIDFINQRIAAFGKAPLCNMIPEHGICIKGFYLPLCARCTGTLIGCVVTIFLFLFVIRRSKYRLSLHILSFLLAVPCLIDGLLQYVWQVESDNFRRILTGLLLGASIVLSIGYFSVLIDREMNRNEPL
jgi:uncharacterized membrane protein